MKIILRESELRSMIKRIIAENSILDTMGGLEDPERVAKEEDGEEEEENDVIQSDDFLGPEAIFKECKKFFKNVYGDANLFNTIEGPQYMEYAKDIYDRFANKESKEYNPTLYNTGIMALCAKSVSQYASVRYKEQIKSDSHVKVDWDTLFVEFMKDIMMSSNTFDPYHKSRNGGEASLSAWAKLICNRSYTDICKYGASMLQPTDYLNSARNAMEEAIRNLKDENYGEMPSKKAVYDYMVKKYANKKWMNFEFKQNFNDLWRMRGRTSSFDNVIGGDDEGNQITLGDTIKGDNGDNFGNDFDNEVMGQELNRIINQVAQAAYKDEVDERNGEPKAKEASEVFKVAFGIGKYRGLNFSAESRNGIADFDELTEVYNQYNKPIEVKTFKEMYGRLGLLFKNSKYHIDIESLLKQRTKSARAALEEAISSYYMTKKIIAEAVRKALQK